MKQRWQTNLLFLRKYCNEIDYNDNNSNNANVDMGNDNDNINIKDTMKISMAIISIKILI